MSWPGWILDDGELVEVPDDRIPTITLRLNGNANTGIVLDYPVCPHSLAGSFKRSPHTAMDTLATRQPVDWCHRSVDAQNDLC